MNIPIIIITNGNSQSLGLYKNLRRYAAGGTVDQHYIVAARDKSRQKKRSTKTEGAVAGTTHGHALDEIATQAHKDFQFKTKSDEIHYAFDGITHGGTLVMAATPSQVKLACEGIENYRNRIPNGKFALILDEADVVYRAHGERLIDKAIRSLIDLNPSMIIQISATPMEFLHLLKCKDFECFCDNSFEENYVGIEDIKPLTVSGKEIFLNNPLTKASEYSDSNVTIRYFNNACKLLTDDALVPNASTPERKGTLILNCSCPFVNVDNNIKEQATEIQKMYRNRDIHLVAVAVSGSGID
ncbi:hypothetical protein ACHAXS_001520, partial [Conticribra weissflogii]